MEKVRFERNVFGMANVMVSKLDRKHSLLLLR